MGLCVVCHNGGSNLPQNVQLYSNSPKFLNLSPTTDDGWQWMDGGGGRQKPRINNISSIKPRYKNIERAQRIKERSGKLQNVHFGPTINSMILECSINLFHGPGWTRTPREVNGNCVLMWIYSFNFTATRQTKKMPIVPSPPHPTTPPRAPCGLSFYPNNDRNGKGRSKNPTHPLPQFHTMEGAEKYFARICHTLLDILIYKNKIFAKC